MYEQNDSLICNLVPLLMYEISLYFGLNSAPKPGVECALRVNEMGEFTVT